MADVQLEKGFTRIANELLEALCRFQFTGSELAIIYTVIRCTYGYQKKEGKISYGLIANVTGITRDAVAKFVKKLAKQKVLIITKQKTITSSNILSLNKNYEKWTVVQRAYRPVVHPDYSAVVQATYTLKKEKKERNILDLKRSFLERHSIN